MLCDSHKFELRQVVEDDHEWLVALHNDPLVLYNVTDPTPITLASHMEWWNGLDLNKEVRLIFCIDKVRAGFCKFYEIDNNKKHCVLGADLHKDFRGKGFAKHMWTEILNVCFGSMGLERVSLTTAEYNKIAFRVYSWLGFETEDVQKDTLLRDGKTFNTFVMSMLKESWNGS